MTNMIKRLTLLALFCALALAPAGASFRVNNLIGFGAGGAEPDLTTGVEITRTLGTLIHDATSNNTVLMDGNTSHTSANSGTKVTSSNFFAGRIGDTPRYLSQAIAYGSTNAGFVAAADPNITLTLYANTTGATPSSCTDGTVVGTLAPFADVVDASGGYTITSIHKGTLYSAWWVCLEQDGGSLTMRIAEVRFYE